MRMITSLTSTLLLLLFSFNSQARTCNCIVDGGDWGTASTWDCAGGPAAGDTINIPTGITVNVDNVYTYTGAAMYINVDGTIHLGKPGSKLFFPCGSIVHFSTTGRLTMGFGGGGSAREIHICDNIWWSQTDGNVVGEVTWGVIIPLASNSYQFYLSENNGKPTITLTLQEDVSADEVQLLKALNDGDFELINSTEIDGQFNFTDNKTIEGTNYYKIELISKSGIQETTIISFEKEHTTQFFPNPAQNVLNVNIENERQFKSIKVFSITGELVHQSNIANEEIDISTWNSGVYLIQIEQLNNVTTNRLVVQ